MTCRREVVINGTGVSLCQFLAFFLGASSLMEGLITRGGVQVFVPPLRLIAATAMIRSSP